jgi:hypothetical protein
LPPFTTSSSSATTLSLVADAAAPVMPCHDCAPRSGGQVTDIDLAAFLSGPGSPEHEALLRLIGASIFNPRGAAADDEPLAVNSGREWSDAEMNTLGEMLVRGVSMDEIARRLRRDHGDVRDKVAEVGRACR